MNDGCGELDAFHGGPESVRSRNGAEGCTILHSSSGPKAVPRFTHLHTTHPLPQSTPTRPNTTALQAQTHSTHPTTTKHRPVPLRAGASSTVRVRRGPLAVRRVASAQAAGHPTHPADSLLAALALAQLLYTLAGRPAARFVGAPRSAVGRGGASRHCARSLIRIARTAGGGAADALSAAVSICLVLEANFYSEGVRQKAIQVDITSAS